MSGRSSPVYDRCEDGAEPAVRLTVRKDLFPDVRLPKLVSVLSDDISLHEDLERVSCVKLETDFEQSIDDIAHQKLQGANGVLSSTARSRHKKRKHKRHVDHSALNGYLTPEKKKKSSPHTSYRAALLRDRSKVKGGKNLNLVSSSECGQDKEIEDKTESSEDEVLKCSLKLPIVVSRQSGKPYSHELSKLSTKKSKSKDPCEERRTHGVTPCSGKPRSMLHICSSQSKRKAKKSDSIPTYQSQIVETSTKLKIKIRRTSVHDVITPTPTSVADLGQRKSKKKRAASPAPSESSGEEYDPSKGDTAAAMSVAAPKPRQVRLRTRKPTNSNTSKAKSQTDKAEKTRVNAGFSKDVRPQSPWAESIPEEILTRIFEYVVATQGTLPSVIRLSRVCKLWYSVSCRQELWKNVDLAQYTKEKCRTDYKLVWLLENRLSKCQSLNIAQWKVCNVSWVLACVVDYCPKLVELSVAGWSRITPEQLFELMQGLPKLQRLDLSLTSEIAGSNTCLSAASMARLTENFGSRLTHLTLANNKFTALPQILSSVAAHCLNLEVLDISGAQATSHPAAVPLEALQKGCPKLRVFRAANSQLVLASATIPQKMEVEGWTQLEELSIAGEAMSERVVVGEYRLGDEALSRLVRGATRLRLLDLRGLQRLSDSGLVRVPAWDLQHLFLGGCNVTRQSNACLELICEKWSHSLLELDLSWASAARALDDAVRVLADAAQSKLRVLNLCGSSVTLEPIKKVLLKCRLLESLNLSSCRALPRGMKRLYTGKELNDLKDSFDPEKARIKTEEDDKVKKKKDTNKTGAHSKSEDSSKNTPAHETSESSVSADNSVGKKYPLSESRNASESENFAVSDENKMSSSNFLAEQSTIQENTESMTSSPKGIRSATPKPLSPLTQSKPDSSSIPNSDSGSPHLSSNSKPDSHVQNSSSIPMESIKCNSSWNLGQFQTDPTHKSEASPQNTLESYSKMKQSNFIEQCSPTTSIDSKRSPDTLGMKQDIKNPSSWNFGNYSPMTRQETQISSQRSPYSSQPSPAQPSPYSTQPSPYSTQPSPYSTQPSPYSTQPSPYSSQPSPYSAQPSPDTSQMVKPDLQKSGAWNPGNFSPMPKHHAPFSPHRTIHTSPDPGIGVKGDSLRNTPNKTPGRYSPMSRHDRQHQSPYSPRSSVENPVYSNKKSPANMGLSHSPMMRTDCHLPSPDSGQPSRTGVPGRIQDIYSKSKAPDNIQNISPLEMHPCSVERFSRISIPSSSGIESLVWGTQGPPRADSLPAACDTAPPRAWGALPAFDGAMRRSSDDISEPWTLPQFRHDRPQRVHNTFVDHNISFESLREQIGQQAQELQNYLDDAFTESSRVD